MKNQRNVEIAVTSFRNSKEIIKDYFGRKNIEILWTKSHFLSQSNNLKENLYEYWYNYFLSSIGACVRFEINKLLKKILDEYIDKEFEPKYKEFLKRYGFFADNLFSRKFNIINEKQEGDFYKEISRNADQIKIKWCGYHWPAIKGYHIRWGYLQSLKFKWDLRPNIVVKKCKKCRKGKKNFVPEYDLRNIIDKIDRWNPHLDHVNDADFCEEHALGMRVYDKDWESRINKEKMEKKLKKLFKLVGFIPPSNFKQDLSYLDGLSKEDYNEAIKTLCDMPSYEFESAQYSSEFINSKNKLYSRVFGSWFNALFFAGIIEKGKRKKTTGYSKVAKDGHFCRSLDEKIIDDWLYYHDIQHDKNPWYPGKYNIQGDWKVGNYFIEYLGKRGKAGFNKTIFIKREIIHNNKGLDLIEIKPENINIKSLNEKLDFLLFLDNQDKKEIISHSNEIIKLSKTDTVEKSGSHKNCIKVNNNKIVNCKYFKVLHPKLQIQKLIEEIEKE